METGCGVQFVAGSAHQTRELEVSNLLFDRIAPLLKENYCGATWRFRWIKSIIELMFGSNFIGWVDSAFSARRERANGPWPIESRRPLGGATIARVPIGERSKMNWSRSGWGRA